MRYRIANIVLRSVLNFGGRLIVCSLNIQHKLSVTILWL